MELWLLIFISFLSIFLAVILNHLLTTPNGTKKKENKRNLPPGPPSVPILGNLLWLTRSLFELEPILRQLRPKYGPIISLRVGSRTLVFITDASVAHKALVQKGSAFSDRPPAFEAGRIMNSNQHNISSASYGPLWRLLRRNLMSEILHPSRVRSYAQGRKWVLDLLTQKLTKHADSGEPVCVVESFQYSMFCLLLLMCFGQKLDKDTVKKIETTQRRLLLNFRKFNIFAFLPRIGKAYISAPEEGGRKLTEGEMVTLCSEFLNGGTDTTSTSLQWIMANLVKHPDLQQKLVEEIEGVVGKEAEEVGEEDLNRMPYLKAVIMEGAAATPAGPLRAAPCGVGGGDFGGVCYTQGSDG
ncbi:cytochrome P450 89A2-like protein [Cinnamomum micranthum f. kanehirae]|uniref:Cytochrome P450 89A2-like protein n=1 Tax=Cinnamomum micranthum f. kanehirae TaxID=337451 RepID=A0A3S3RB93_9MAGN|nr:cytochrome P450 89A2-like protein [Cinnamomum micranthum f. kanehirae]